MDGHISLFNVLTFKINLVDIINFSLFERNKCLPIILNINNFYYNSPRVIHSISFDPKCFCTKRVTSTYWAIYLIEFVSRRNEKTMKIQLKSVWSCFINISCLTLFKYTYVVIFNIFKYVISLNPGIII